MANSMTIEQASTVLNAIQQQITGQATLAPINTSQFVNVAQNVLLAGYDSVIGAISNVLARTVFSIRPYNRKFRIIENSPQKYGMHVRKLQTADQEWEDNEEYTLTDGESVDMYVVKKPSILQTNFYGAITRQRHITLFQKQLDTAFRGPEEFAMFITMVMTNASDMIEQAHEGLARMTVANYIAGMSTLANANQTVHLVTEFNTELGLDDDEAYTLETLKVSAMWDRFIRWSFARMKTASDLLTDRSAIFHNNIPAPGGTDALPIMRHTPIERQRAFFYGPDLNKIGTGTLATTYHDDYLKMLKNERVNFWQNITNGDSINVKAAYTKADGTAAVTTDSVSVGNVFGVLFDEEAMGTCVMNTWSERTPFNAAGGYSNIYWHFTDKWWNDWTENAILFLMD